MVLRGEVYNWVNGREGKYITPLGYVCGVVNVQIVQFHLEHDYLAFSYKVHKDQIGMAV